MRFRPSGYKCDRGDVLAPCPWADYGIHGDLVRPFLAPPTASEGSSVNVLRAGGSHATHAFERHSHDSTSPYRTFNFISDRHHTKIPSTLY